MGKGNFKGNRGEDSERYTWDGIAGTAHYDIARLCLDYLSRPGVGGIIDSMCRVSETFGAQIFADHGNLCSYALQAWPHHFRQASSADQRRLAAQFNFISSPLGRDWARGYWALPNPITRSKVTLDSLFPIFAGLGLCGSEGVKARDYQGCGRVDGTWYYAAFCLCPAQVTTNTDWPELRPRCELLF
ncbi:hypothetical protein B0T25DRAFT_550574 [Lasiosphaeria hispida]|uniref:Uncharacterized protein n=1 Tax=Lasiosphaeria hispida TaxID=260671 RepID=A0AAJ0HA83_9PEZI|nr:hypothetical protein B0T25DRAFT_550574 [Lasiosphaeria hispida]